jgi:hypothetical protein
MTLDLEHKIEELEKKIELMSFQIEDQKLDSEFFIKQYNNIVRYLRERDRKSFDEKNLEK